MAGPMPELMQCRVVVVGGLGELAALRERNRVGRRAVERSVAELMVDDGVGGLENFLGAFVRIPSDFGSFPFGKIQAFGLLGIEDDKAARNQNSLP